MKKSKAKMKIYDTLDSITVYLFFKILDTEDYSYLIKKREKFVDKISELKIIELQNVFKNIITEYSLKTNNFKLFNDIKKKIYISKLEYEFSLLSSIIKIFEKYEEIEVLFVLDDIGYDFKNCNNIEKEVNKVVKKCKALKNKININKIKYNNSNKKSSKEKQDYNIDSIALSLERALDLKYKLDVKETTMLRWINLIDLSKKNKK